MLYAPSYNWTCLFPASAIIVTGGLFSCFGFSSLLLIVPMFIFYPIFMCLRYKENAIYILVDQKVFFVRQGLDPEIEYELQEGSSFVVIKKRFKTIFQIEPWEWFFPNPKEPVRLVMLLANGSQQLLFSYQNASPFKRNWSKFAAKLELQTGKIIKLKEDN